MNPNIFSDLRKPGLVPGESLSLSIKIDSVIEKYLSYNMTNRMRSIHMKKVIVGSQGMFDQVLDQTINNKLLAKS